MIIFVMTAEHPYTLEEVIKGSPGVEIRIATYDWLLEQDRPPRATYVFTDVDRLAMWRVRQAATTYRRLRAEGMRVLNDPARLPSRYGLLRNLYRAGLNAFDAYRAEEGLIPVRWPVFLRTEGGHDAPLTGLMRNWDETRRAVNDAIAAGYPITSLLIIEYAAQPVRPDLFRKLSVFRIGDAYVGANCVHEDNWLVKYGAEGIATADLYADDLRIVRDNPFEGAMRPVFELAAIEYGRSDFGLVGGKVQTYEINTNPHIEFPTDHPFEDRVESYRIFQRNFNEALAKIDTPTS